MLLNNDLITSCEVTEEKSPISIQRIMLEYFSIKKNWYYDTCALAFLDGDRMLSYVKGTSVFATMKSFKKEQARWKRSKLNDVSTQSSTKQVSTRKRASTGT